MAKASVLVKTAPSADLQKVAHVLQEPGVTGLELVMGPFDAIATIEDDDFESLGQLAREIRACPGVLDSVTCPVM